MAIIEMERPPVIGETFPMEITCVRSDDEHSRLDLTGATIWMTLKTDPTTQADAAAALQIDNGANPTQFEVNIPNTNGVFTATFTATQTATLTAGTVYYIDVKVKTVEGYVYYPVPIQQIIFDQWVTRSTS